MEDGVRERDRFSPSAGSLCWDSIRASPVGASPGAILYCFLRRIRRELGRRSQVYARGMPASQSQRLQGVCSGWRRHSPPPQPGLLLLSGGLGLWQAQNLTLLLRAPWSPETTATRLYPQTGVLSPACALFLTAEWICLSLLLCAACWWPQLLLCDGEEFLPPLCLTSCVLVPRPGGAGLRLAPVSDYLVWA